MYRKSLAIIAVSVVCLTSPVALAQTSETPPPSPQPSDAPTITVTRYAGADRYETAIAITKALYPDASQSSIILAAGDQFADAISAANLLAPEKPQPILLTPGSALPESVVEELKRLATNEATVTLIGGENALASDIETQLEAIGFATRRLAGENRVDTGLTILKTLTLDQRASGMVITPAEDATLGAIGAAHALTSNARHLYAYTDPLNNAALGRHIDDQKPRHLSVLGSVGSALSPELSMTIWQADFAPFVPAHRCYPDQVDCVSSTDVIEPGQPAQTIAEKLLTTQFNTADHLIMVSGSNPTDGIAATQLAAAYNAPVVPVYTSPVMDLHPSHNRYLSIMKSFGKRNWTIHLVGGSQALPATLERDIEQAL